MLVGDCTGCDYFKEYSREELRKERTGPDQKWCLKYDKRIYHVKGCTENKKMENPTNYTFIKDQLFEVETAIKEVPPLIAGLENLVEADEEIIESTKKTVLRYVQMATTACNEALVEIERPT